MNYPELKMIERVENVSMSNLTHTKTGGIVPVMFYPKNLGELKRSCDAHETTSAEI